MSVRKLIHFPIVLCAMLVSCSKIEVYDNTPKGNFEALWNIIDERYCFFDYKAEEYGLDWDAVYHQYKRKIAEDMSSTGLFEVLGDMLDELRDGHVNLYAAHDVARYWNFHEGYAISAISMFLPSPTASARATLMSAYMPWLSAAASSSMCAIMGEVTSRMPRRSPHALPMSECSQVTSVTRQARSIATSRRPSRYT